MEIDINSGQPIIQVKQVSKVVYSGGEPLTILHDINININWGDTLTVLGASGAGKSTLLSLLAGLDVPTQGDILLGQYALQTLGEDERAALRLGNIGFVFQSFKLLNNLNALENVMLPLELLEDSASREKAIDSLNQVGLSRRLSHYPWQLSGGEQQRVAIARAFAISPKILFADEPTGNLDQRTASHVIDLLFQLNEKSRTTLVIVTHNSHIAQRTQRLITLDDGRLQPNH